MLLTTTNTVEGKQIEQYYGVVTGEVVIGAHVFKDISASIRDLVGGRSGSYERLLGQSREDALREMSERAAKMGANAVIAIDLDYETIGSMMIVAVSGTAVRIG